MRSRRDVLAWLAGAGMVTVVAGCRSSSSAKTAAPATTAATAGAASGPAGGATCVLSPEQTEGPFFLPGEAVRSDITEGKPGVALRLALVVVDVSRCAAVPNASIDIWHADATGNYSGFNAEAGNRTFLRGIQVTGGDGRAEFRTVYPGWYQGRATHIHVKVNVGGNVVHTGQLFFDEAVSRAVYGAAPYDARPGTRTLNSQDGIYRSGGAQSMLRLTPEGRGYVGAIVLGVRAAST
jgi:protocatechuate 3,4-dioxygenase beta subunit